MDPSSIATAKWLSRHPRANQVLSLALGQVAYLLERSRRRTVGMIIRPEGLVVRAPRWVGLVEIDRILHAKASWIERKLDPKHPRWPASVQTQRFDNGATFSFLGRPVQLCIDGGAKNTHQDDHVIFDEENAILNLMGNKSLLHSGEQLRQWLCQQALHWYEQRLNHFAPLLGVRWLKLELSSARTRWGSAKGDGSIRLHWRLIQMQPDLIDYVVVHELAHLREMNHSPAFWGHVSRLLPNQAQLRKQLRATRLPEWD